MPRWLTVPNLFTALRLVLAPFVVQAILAGDHVRALCLFLAAGFTDWLDGAAARRWGATTRSGAYFDPVADKVLLSAVFIALAVAGIVPRWFVWLVFGRDFYILAAVGLVMLATPRREFPPSPWGKVSTFFQISVAVAWMVRNAFPGSWQDTVAFGLLWTSTAFTLLSGIHYTWHGVRSLRLH